MTTQNTNSDESARNACTSFSPPCSPRTTHTVKTSTGSVAVTLATVDQSVLHNCSAPSTASNTPALTGPSSIEVLPPRQLMSEVVAQQLTEDPQDILGDIDQEEFQSVMLETLRELFPKETPPPLPEHKDLLDQTEQTCLETFLNFFSEPSSSNIAEPAATATALGHPRLPSLSQVINTSSPNTRAATILANSHLHRPAPCHMTMQNLSSPSTSSTTQSTVISNTYVPRSVLPDPNTYALSNHKPARQMQNDISLSAPGHTLPRAAAMHVTIPAASASYAIPQSAPMYSIQSTPERLIQQRMSYPSTQMTSRSVSPSRESSQEQSADASQASTPKRATARGMKRLLTEDEKRVNHIASERKRRLIIKNAFESLHFLVPGCKGFGHASSKSNVLLKTAEFIRTKQMQNQMLASFIHQLNMKHQG